MKRQVVKENQERIGRRVVTEKTSFGKYTES